MSAEVRAGLGFSGGQARAIFCSVCALQALDTLTSGRINPKANRADPRIAVSTVSGGSVGYMAAANWAMATPPLRPDYTPDSLRNFPVPNGTIPITDGAGILAGDALFACVTELISASPGEQCQELSPAFAECLLSFPLGACLTTLVGEVFEHRGPLSPGPYRLIVNMAVTNRAHWHFGNADADAFAANAALVRFVAEDGRSQLLVSSRGAFDPDGRWLNLQGRLVPVDLFVAVGYSLSFFTMPHAFLIQEGFDRLTPQQQEGEPCRGPFEETLPAGVAAFVRDFLTEQSLLSGVWQAPASRRRPLFSSAARKPTAVATESSLADVLGFTALLAERVRTVIQFVVHTVLLDSDDGAHLARRFFGASPARPPEAYPCQYQAPELLRAELQVFEAAAWPGVQRDLLSTGIAVLHNVSVLDNPFLGIEAYTLDTLVLVSNAEPPGFSSYMHNWADIRAELLSDPENPSAGWPAYDGALSFPELDAATLCVAEKYKVLELHRDALLEALAPVL